MAFYTPRYAFTEENVSQVAARTNQADRLIEFKRVLRKSSLPVSAVYDATKTLGSTSDYGASVLSEFLGSQPTTLHYEVISTNTHCQIQGYNSRWFLLKPTSTSANSLSSFDFAVTRSVI